MPEKKQMATPVRKGMNPVPGEAGVPSLYCREPRHTANPNPNHTALLSWSLFNSSNLSQRISMIIIFLGSAMRIPSFSRTGGGTLNIWFLIIELFFS
jgi:hypothetical protein